MAVFEILSILLVFAAPAKGGKTALNYTSPYLHTVVIANLTPGTQYFYQVSYIFLRKSNLKIACMRFDSPLPVSFPDHASAVPEM